eukprot:4217394-Pyramimonas_sp.AAC.1
MTETPDKHQMRGRHHDFRNVAQRSHHHGRSAKGGACESRSQPERRKDQGADDFGRQQRGPA